MMDFELSVRKTAMPVDPFDGIDFPQAIPAYPGEAEVLTPKLIYPMLMTSSHLFISEMTGQNCIPFILRYALCSLRYAIFKEVVDGRTV